MTQKKAESLQVNLPEIKTPVEIDGAWLTKRDGFIGQVNALLESKKDGEWFEKGSAILKEVSRSLKDFEQERLKLCRPFNDAAKAIKGCADAAKATLENKKTALKKALSSFTVEEEKKAEAEAPRREFTGAAPRSDPQGGADSLPVKINDMAAPPKSTNSIKVDSVVFTILNPDVIPRELCSPDPAKIRAKIRERKEALLDMLKSKESRESNLLIPGLLLKVKTDVRSR